MIRKAAATCLMLLLSAAAHGTSPNILLLVAEDLSPRIGAYGDGIAHTPNLDALAQRSTRYTRVFTTAGVCAPSRAALIMGRHQISFGAQHMRTSTGPLGPYLAVPPAGARAFPELLRAAGYYTYTDRKLDYQFSGVFAGSGPFTIWDEDGASDTAWRNRAPGQPFFAMINFLETHESGVMRQTGEPHSEAHRATMRFRAPFTSLRTSRTAPRDVVLPPYYPDLSDVRTDMARHYDNIAVMDARVGRILDALEGDGLTDSTLILFTTDHGDGLPRAKRELYDSGLRVPLLISRPGQVDPDVRDELVSFVDLAPTLLNWAGAEVPDGLHGRDIDGPGPERRYVYAARDRIDEVQDLQRAIRDRRFKLIRSSRPDVPGGHALAYRDNLDMVRAWRTAYEAGALDAVQRRWFEPAGAVQLYDLAEDPHETRDLSEDDRYRPILDRLQRALDAFLARVGDRGQISEAQMRDALLDEGEIRRTPPPTLSREASGIAARSSVGASIGYRRGAEERWRLYTGPISVEPAQTLTFKAVRYGWRESESITLN